MFDVPRVTEAGSKLLQKACMFWDTLLFSVFCEDSAEACCWLDSGIWQKGAQLC